MAISVKNVSKKFRRYASVADGVKEVLHPFRKKYHKEFWALRDISFEVKKGETVGIIGRNGSGKSTLLQILCGIMLPTMGEVKIQGRISALLELGAGFSPQFTGRENVYMNGAIMGLTKEEVDEKFQSIVDFADIGEFIDQPVRTYSSGMYVRLAFAAAINVDPDILVVDEALAVGDARFQKKCYDKMNSLKKSGTTIIIVTHAHDTLKTFSTKAVLLDAGRMLQVGDPGEVVLKYMQLSFPDVTEQEGGTGSELGFSGIKIADVSLEREAEQDYCFEIIPSKDDEAKSFGAGGAWVNWIKIFGLRKSNMFYGGEKLEVQISFSWDRAIVEKTMIANSLLNNLILGCGFDNVKGVTIFGFNTFDAGIFIDPLKTNTGRVSFIIQMPILMGGSYFMYPAVVVGTQEQHVRLKWYGNLIQLECVPNKKYIFGVLKLNYEGRRLDT